MAQTRQQHRPTASTAAAKLWQVEATTSQLADRPLLVRAQQCHGGPSQQIADGCTIHSQLAAAVAAVAT